MRKFLLISLFLSVITGFAQTGTEFWIAPPDVTYRHNLPGDEPIFLNVTTGNAAAVVTVSQPANPAFNGSSPIILNIPANSAVRYDMTSLKAQLETKPTNSVRNTGLLISSTEDITCYYESSNTNNPDILALKGANGLGYEFYIPLHKHAPFYNHDYSSHPNDLAYASFDIVATEDNTTIMIYSPVDVDGHSALTAFSITLNRGQTYSCANTDLATHTDPSTHPSGAVVLSDKPVAISIKDDSNHNPSGGCYDLMLDQIVPVDILGTEYVAVKGQLNTTGDESLFIMAVENNTEVYIDGSAIPVATLFAGQYYRQDMDYLGASADNSTYVSSSKPVYAIHVTGFGCEQGMAILPPLNCAGSRQLSFTRSTSEPFYLNLLVRAGSENDFVVTPATAAINGTSFIPVPGTGGQWLAAQIQYNTTEVPVNNAFLVTNTSDVFSLAIINGGATSGCRYGFFSEFAGKIITDAGLDQTICAGDDATLVGSVNGGSITGQWTTSGSGTFSPSDTDLNATYTPSLGDQALGSVTITLTSTGNCTPESDDMELSIQPQPIVDAGSDISVCTNNPSFSLSGSVLNAAGGVWSGGAGVFLPANSDLNATYTATPGEIASGNLTLYLSSTGNASCSAITDSVEITFTPSPTANAGADQILCSNNPVANLAGSFTVASGGIWSGGAGSFDPSTTNMSATYTPSAAEISGGSVTLTLTTTNNGNCNAVSDQVTLNFTPSPTANAGADISVCENNPTVSLAGVVTGATGGQWTGGTGLFSPDNLTLGAIYTPSAAEIAAGTITLNLSTTGNGNCIAVSDAMTINITNAPVVDAGSNASVCATGGPISLNGSVTVATGGLWSGGAGSFNPNNTDLNATYTPTFAEVAAGSVTLTLTSVGNGTCNPESDNVTFTITPGPTVDAGANQTLCGNNPTAALNATLTVATGVQWTGGAGSYTPASNAQSITYIPTAGEITSGLVTLTATTTGNGTCAVTSDQVSISYTNPPVANAGADVSVSSNNADVNLNGSFALATGGQWSGGLGTYNPSNTDPNAIYSPTVAEIAAGALTLTFTTTGNGNCIAVSDDMTITFTAAPTANAGADQTVCSNNADVNLNGAVTIASGGIWSGGAGTFSPNNTDLNATYSPTPAEIASGSLSLTLTTIGNGNSNPVSDQMTITFGPSPTVNAGADLSSCANQADVDLAGSVNNANGTIWSGGLGTFNPSNTNTLATYTPTAAEIASGSVTLTLTSTGNGNCNAVSDQMTISIAPAPVVNAGSDLTACGNNPTVTLGGNISNAGGGIWSGGTGAFSPSINALNAQYTPSSSELLNGSVTLTLTSTGNGSCAPESDDVLIVFSQGPTVNAGSDIIICENDLTANLAGSVTIATGGTWTGGSGVFTPNTSDLNAVYQPSPAEVALGSVTLTLTSSGNGNCLPESDNITITIIPSAVADAGADMYACSNNPTVQLGASVNGAGGGQWSGGAGSFTPSIASLNATYSPTTAEVANGSVTLTLTTIGNGNCTAISDDVTITFTAPPTVDAGTGSTYCSNNSVISLGGNVTVASGGVWSGVQGTFSPSSSDLNATYTPSLGEITAGSVSLVLSSTGNNGCIAVTDTVTYDFSNAPVSDAGGDTSVCASNAAVNLNGSIQIASGGLWSGGTGSFNPGPGTLNATYTPSVSEINAGIATLALTTVGNGNCNAETDSVVITIDPVPVVNAGPDQDVCSNNPIVLLSGFVGNASGGLWTGGNGTYALGNNALATQYVPTAAEVASGSLTLSLSSTGTLICNSITDQMTITFSDAPIAEAGADLVMCSNNPVVQLQGNVFNASGGAWSNGSGTFSPSANVLSPQYTPTPAEIASGSIQLVLATAGNGDCFSVQDTIAITFTPSPTIDAGADLDVCSNNPVVDLNGSVNVATGAIWSGGLGSYSTSNTDMNASYTLSPFEIQTGSVTLTLTSTGNGNCIAVQDQITVNVTSAPIVNAGVDMTICANDLNVPLNGSVVGSTNTGVWSSTGTGQFVLSPNNLNATYQASPLDSLNGTVTLTLTSTNNGLCFSESDDLVINILPNAIANAGNDQDICSSDASIQLNGSITGNASQGSWTTTGGGVFVPDANTSNATYLLDSMDASASSIQFTWTINSCDNASDDMTVNITQPSQVSVGNDVVTCVDQLDIVLNGNVTGSSNTGIWTTNGTGTFTQGSTAVANIYQASPLDSIAQSVELVLTATNTGACAADADTIVAQILPYGTVDAGVDETFCANNIALQLNGSLSGDATSIQWNTSGTGTFAPNASVLTPTYIPSAVDTAIGSVTLTLAAINSCNSANDAMTLTLTPAPFVDAGPDQTYCNLVTTFNLNGTISGITTVGAWSTTGSGSIGNPGSLNTTYTASQADINAGRIDFTLTSLNNQNCNPVTDEMTIWLTNGLIADAGPDQSVCVTSEFAQMQGSVQNGPPMGLWTTTGSGTFYPSANVLNAEYHFTPADIANGSVVLTLTSTDNGNCVAVQDQMVLTFGSASFAFAGDDQTVCANAPLVQLAGNFSGGAQGCSWTTTGTGFFSNSTDPNSSYSLSNADIASGSVTLTLTTITDGSCTASSDDIIISVDELPNVFVGVDVIACTSDPIQLSANVSNATGVNWSTSGTGTFLDPNALVTLYYPSVSDSTAGSVTLTAITTGNGECTSASDDMSISFGGNLGADAGSDVVRCSTAPDVSLAATVSGTTTGVWSTSGTGSFVPSANDLNATYIPGPADFVIGDIHLTISTTNNQGCPASKDTMTISYHNPPTVDAGQSITLCDGLQDMQLNALVQNQANMQWFTTGTGSFGPSDTIASPIYYPTANDSIVGGVHLILTAYGTGTCGNKTDSLFLDIGPTRIADAGPDQNICANGDSIQLTGNIIGVNNGVWATNGTGTFSPNAQDPNAVYTPSATDLVFNQLQFTLSTTDNQGCPAHVDTMTLNLQAPPTANAGPDISTCDASQPVQLNGSFTGATGIEWSTNGTGIFVPNAQSENALYQPSASDSLMQQVQLVISTMGNQFCDASSDTTVISFVNPLSPAFNTSNLCAGSESVLTDASQISNGNIIAWNWEFPNGVQKSGVQVQHTFPTAGQYAISLTVIADNGCSATITEVVDVLSAPTASFDMTGDPFVGFDLNFTDQSFGANSWIYDFGDGQGGSLEQNPVYQYSNPGQYLIIQTVYNSAGCADSDSMLVFIDTKDILPPKLPNAFTPNGDGTNDVFYVRGGPFETIDLKIYNGWGEVIFTTTDPEFGWDGMHEDKPAINGVYVYTIEATTTDGKSHSRTGKITLIR